MRGFILGILFTLIALVVGAFVFLKLGYVDVRADKPVGRVERQVANMAMDASVERAAKAGRFEGKDNPVRPTEDNLMTGAMLYEKNCAMCHGSSADRGHASPMSSAFYPNVPQIVRRIPGDPDWHLFWVTKTGIRWTGMPAWGKTLNDNDIWTIITFVKNSDRLPQSVQEMWRSFATPSGVAPAASPSPTPSAAPTPAAKAKSKGRRK